MSDNVDGLKELILSETASIFEVLSWESINRTWRLPYVVRYSNNLVRCDKRKQKYISGLACDRVSGSPRIIFLQKFRLKAVSVTALV